MTDIGLTRGISETKLSRSLDALVEDCVNAVGVDASTASAPLLARVSGIGAGLAQNIVLHRDAHGPFRSRKDVPRLGPKAFEQCAGFLRIAHDDDPLDASGDRGVPVIHGARVVLVEDDRHDAGFAESAIGEADSVSLYELCRRAAQGLFKIVRRDRGDP
jgi:uncharacterized protein